MTSNLGASLITEAARPLGFGTVADENENMRASVMKKLKEAFRPEFLNRIDDIIVFNKLGAEDIEKITLLIEGACFLNVLAPCPRGWGYNTEDLMQINKLAVDTCYWPLYEVVNGVYKITYKPAKKLPIEEFLKPQKRFKHMFKPGNEWMIEAFQKEVDERWQELLDLEEMTNKQ